MITSERLEELKARGIGADKVLLNGDDYRELIDEIYRLQAKNTDLIEGRIDEVLDFEREIEKLRDELSITKLALNRALGFE